MEVYAANKNQQMWWEQHLQISAQIYNNNRKDTCTWITDGTTIDFLKLRDSKETFEFQRSQK